MRPPLAFLLLLFFAFSAAFGQQKLPRHFTTNEGLPGNSIRCIYKDSRGFVWLGTDAGLCRYDGSGFVNYSSKDGLANDHIWAIAEDDKQNLILGCYGGGLSYYDGKKFRSITEKEGLKLTSIRNLYFNHDNGSLYAGTQDGVLIIDKAGKITEISRALKNFNQQLLVGAITKKNKDTLYISSLSSGNYYLEIKTAGITPLKAEDPWNTLNGYCIIEDEDEKCMGAADGLRMWRKGVFDFYRYPAAMRYPTWGVCKESDSSYWMVNWGGGDGHSYGDIIHFNGITFSPCKHKFGIKGVDFWAVYFDRDTKRLFVGTLANGLYVIALHSVNYFPVQLERESSEFSQFIDSRGMEWIVAPKELHCNGKSIYPEDYFNYMLPKLKQSDVARNKVLQDPSMNYEKVERLIAEEKYLCRNPFLNDQAKPVSSSDTGWLNPQRRQFGRPTNWSGYDSHFKSYFSFGKVFQDSKGRYWLSTTLGLLQIDPVTFRPLKYANVGSLRYFGTDRSGRIWCHQEYEPLNCILSADEPLRYKTFRPRRGHPVPADVQAMAESPNGDLWLGTWNQGLFRYRNETFKSFTRKNSFLTGTDVSALCFTREGHLVVGHPNGDIEICDTKDSLVPLLKLDQYSGYAGNSILLIIQDPKGNLIIVTNKALVRFKYGEWLKTKELVFQNIDASVGFALEGAVNGNIFNNSHTLWLVEAGKKIAVDLDELEQLEYAKDSLFFESVLVNYRKPDWDSSYRMQSWSLVPAHLELPHDQNFLEFHFNNLNISAASADLFRYKMEGLNGQWSQFSNVRKALFTSLPPGNYKFIVQCRNAFRKGGMTEASLSVVILPPWWKTAWFNGLACLGLILLVFALIRFREKKLQQRQKELEQMVRERTAELVEKKNEIEKQKHLLEEKQKEILDSIRYAKRIQSSLMPTEKFIQRVMRMIGKG